MSDYGLWFIAMLGGALIGWGFEVFITQNLHAQGAKAMSEQVKRYDMCIVTGGMIAREGGSFCHIEDYATLQAECERYKAAYGEWSDKTEWVQQTATAKELGKHRADVLRERIDALEMRIAAIKAQAAKNVLLAQLEKPSDLVTGTTNWAAYIASSVVSPFSAAAREALSLENQRITPAVNPQLTTAGNDS